MFCYWSSSKDIALLEKDNINKKRATRQHFENNFLFCASEFKNKYEHNE